ncbi:NINE protein [Pseudoxanthobacter sp.]|uniref:TM2 domain-containing protein n=1 Tax=Pseudoxanthobacter sp. TaxID=1925742 RepID=UPI002FE1D35E
MSELAANQKYCVACGHPLHISARTCPNCGAVQPGLSSRNKLAAALLAFFLGGFGIHRFYLGRPVSGFFYLLFCWTVIPAILGFIEAILLLMMSEERFAQKYG